MDQNQPDESCSERRSELPQKHIETRWDQIYRNNTNICCRGLLHFTDGSALNGIPFNSMDGFKELLMPPAAKSTVALRGPTSTTTTKKANRKQKTLQKQTKHNYSVSGDTIM